MSWRRRRLLAGAGSVSVAALSGCLSLFGDDGRSLPEPPTGTWQQSGHDAGNTCASDVTVPDRGTPAWNGGSATTIPPLIDGGTVYSVGDGLTALDAETGDRRWGADFDGDSSSTLHTQPAVAGGHVLLGSEGRLRSFDPETGDERWGRAVEGAPIGPITVGPDEQLGIVPFERPRRGEAVIELVAFAVDSGETAWTAPILASVRTTPPAMFDGRVYAGGYTRDDTPILRCFGADDGGLVWERELADPTTEPIATEAGVLTGDGGDIAVHDPAEGERLASIEVTDREIRGIAVADGTAFVLAERGVIAVSIPDGSERWSVEGSPRADGLAVGRNAVVAPISSDAFDLDTAWPCIAAFDRGDGAIRWYHAIDERFDPAIGAPPVVADGAVFAMSNKRSGITALGDLPPVED
jgi:outer membrane protein assembly factor BamB